MDHLNSAGKKINPSVTEVDGVWRLVRSKEATDWLDVADSKLLVFRWNRRQITTKDSAFFSIRKIEVDETKSPRQIRFVDAETGKTVCGIYRVEANRMTLAIAGDIKARAVSAPTNFDVDSNWLYEYELLHE